MQYIEKSASYNERRYGRPWMAIITTSATKDFTFVDWEGRNGCAGEFCFDAEPGTLLAYGQKDIRKGRGGIDGYQICMPDGTMPGLYGCNVSDLRRMPLPQRVASVATAALAVAEKDAAEVAPVASNRLADPTISDHDRNYFLTSQQSAIEGHAKRIAGAQKRISRYQGILSATAVTI